MCMQALDVRVACKHQLEAPHHHHRHHRRVVVVVLLGLGPAVASQVGRQARQAVVAVVAAVVHGRQQHRSRHTAFGGRRTKHLRS